MRILVVDDDENIRKILKLMLKEYEVLEASNGKEAVEVFEKFKPDIVLMDVVMPEMGGIEATKEILKINPKAIIIGVTAFGVNMKERLISAGAVEVIEKPFSKNTVCEIIRKYAIMV